MRVKKIEYRLCLALNMKTFIKSKALVQKNYVDDKTNAIFVERLERLFEIMEKSNGWKSKYEYYQLAKDVNENSIIVSET
jgi:hypothetical protein